MTNKPERSVEEMEDIDDFITDEITTCMEGYRTSVDGIEATYYIDRLTEVITQELQTERQKRDEVVERIIDLLPPKRTCRFNPHSPVYGESRAQQDGWNNYRHAVLKALTQSNNTK